MDSRIARLDVRATADAEVADAVRQLVPQFARRVLVRCDQILEERAPGRCIVMRRLDTRWRLRADLLDDDHEAEAVARALADGLELEAGGGSGDVVTFENEIAYRADYLTAVAEGRDSAWCFQALREEGPAPGVLAQSALPSLAEAVLVCLAERGALATVLCSLMPRALDGLANVLGAASLVPALSSLIGFDEDAPQGAVDRVLALPVSAPVTAGRILCQIEARRTSGPHASASRVRAAAERLFGRLQRARDGGRTITNDPVPASASRPSADDLSEPPASRGLIETRFGGLFYLLTPALELSLGEIVWKACLPERVFFSRLALLLLGSGAADDPAPRLFGGSVGDLTCDVLDPDRLDQMTVEMLSAVAEAFPRRGLAAWPRIAWCVADSGGGRLLIATAAGTEFPLFAWPFTSGSAVEAAMRRFLAAWPGAAPAQVAHPALADADPAGRVVPDLRIPLSRPVLAAAVDDAGYAAALTQAAGSLACLFSMRTGATDLRSPSLLVERHLSVPARIARGRDEIVIHLPADRIDLPLRRVGLDRDPGWVPWLRAHVRFEYDDARELDRD
jgi:hypothetical protein